MFVHRLCRYGFFNNKRIVLFDTLIKECSEEQVVAVLAHGERSSCSWMPQQQSLQGQQQPLHQQPQQGQEQQMQPLQQLSLGGSPQYQQQFGVQLMQPQLCLIRVRWTHASRELKIPCCPSLSSPPDWLACLLPASWLACRAGTLEVAPHPHQLCHGAVHHAGKLPAVRWRAHRTRLV
jgi:hypothetical protein